MYECDDCGEIFRTAGECPYCRSARVRPVDVDEDDDLEVVDEMEWMDNDTRE